jgi:cation:H+ antiporter
MAAILIAWGAESAQVIVSQGLALAVLAWLQTSPEFMVEGVIAWHQDINLMTANFTGALRLLVGFAWPMVYFTAYFSGHKKSIKYEIKLEGEDSAPIVGILLPALYGLFIATKASLTLVDSGVLLAMYFAYLFVLNRCPAKHEESVEEMERVPRWILSHSKPVRNILILSCFVVGGGLVFLLAEPFVESLKALAITLGIPTYFFVQWVAPFLSEFPEFVSAFYWARSVKKAPMSLMNTVSSVIAELTLLVALIPIVYSFSRGEPSSIPFDFSHRIEIYLTIVQSLLGFFFLANMRFGFYEAAGLAFLWFFQFLFPGSREEIIFVYIFWITVELVFLGLGRRKLAAFPAFADLWHRHILKKTVKPSQ